MDEATDVRITLNGQQLCSSLRGGLEIQRLGVTLRSMATFSYVPRFRKDAWLIISQQRGRSTLSICPDRTGVSWRHVEFRDPILGYHYAAHQNL